MKFEVTAMHEIDGLKKHIKAAVVAGILCLVFLSPSGYAQEPPLMDQIKSAPTPTAQNPVVTPETNQLKSAPTSTETSKAAPAQADQLMSAPTSTGEPKPASALSATMDKQDRSGGGMIANGEMLTLTQCIEIALDKNPSIVAAVNTVGVNRSKVGEARSAYYPQVSASGGYGRTKPLSDSTNDTTAYNQYTGSVTVNQTLFDFGRTWSSVNISKYNLDSARSDLDTVQNTVILSVKQAYYALLQAKRNRDVAADVIKQYQLHLDQAKGFYEVGTKAKIDVIKAQVDLSNARLSLINAENALKIARVNLNNAMGVPDAPDYLIEDNLEFKPYAVTLEEATTKAFDNRPDLKSTIAKRQAAEENVSLQRSDYLPTLSGSAGYSRVGTPENLPVNRSENSWNAGVTLTFPIFSGFLTSHKVAEAKSSLYVVRANEEALRQQILLEVRQAYFNLHAAEASISTTELALKQAKENLDLANGRYAAGVGSPIEVSDAFATYVTAQANYTGALYNYRTAQANIEKAMGAR